MRKLLLITGLVIAVDQVSKYIATVFGLVHLNTGVSFGLLTGLPTWVLSICLLGVLVLVAVSYKTYWLQHTTIAGLFFGSAVSNIIDRFLFSGVKDWLVIPFTNIYNNIADWLIFFAIIWMLYTFKVEKNHESSRIRNNF